MIKSDDNGPAFEKKPVFKSRLRSRIEILLLLYFLFVLFYLAITIGASGGVGLPPAETISRVTGWVTPLLSSSVTLGFVVMAIIQLLKPISRVPFHRRQIKLWLINSGEFTAAGEAKVSSPVDAPDVFVNNFLERISPGQGDALLELPIEQLTAQMQAAAELTLASGQPSDWFIKAIVGKQGTSVDAKDDWTTDNQSTEPDDNDSKAAAQMRERTQLSYILQRRLDVLQIQVRSHWRRWLRLQSLLIGVSLTSTVGIVFDLWRQNFLRTVFLVLLLSALGGFFASVARDAVAIIERLRN
jgi:hypothetical protein